MLSKILASRLPLFMAEFSATQISSFLSSLCETDKARTLRVSFPSLERLSRERVKRRPPSHQWTRAGGREPMTRHKISVFLPETRGFLGIFRDMERGFTVERKAVI